jgi:CRP-like cAMP-binding protein
MTVSYDGARKGVLEGMSISANELHIQYKIPREEIASFQNCTYIYPNREVIIQEGEREKALYLLRFGTVEIFKGAGESQELIGAIEAVNFFGEMSLVNDEARSATVISSTNDVVVYKISQPNIKTILTNPKWAELLVSRLCKNLAKSNELHMLAAEQAKVLRSDMELQKKEIENLISLNTQTARNIRLAVNGILHFQGIVQRLAIVGSKGWSYLNALTNVTRALISHYIPNLDESDKTVEVNVIREYLSELSQDEHNKIFHELNELL